jgi:hypothetical protein
MSDLWVDDHRVLDGGGRAYEIGPAAPAFSSACACTAFAINATEWLPTRKDTRAHVER